MKRDALIVFVLWLTLTLVGEVIAVLWDYQPLAAAEEAGVVDGAFFVLVVMAIPVVAFVVAAVLYSVLRFGRRGERDEDGPPIRTSRPVVISWFLVTTALTILVIIFPGTIGLLELRDHSQGAAASEGGMVVRVEGSRWVWKITYPEQGVTSYGELVLPVGRQVRFEVTAIDVIHAFWVPAFRMKVDAVPGQVTTIYATPDRTGEFTSNSGYRLQCAEMCGLGHSLMTVPVRVVDAARFDAWAAQQAPTASLNP